MGQVRVFLLAVVISSIFIVTAEKDCTHPLAHKGLVSYSQKAIKDLPGPFKNHLSKSECNVMDLKKQQLKSCTDKTKPHCIVDAISNCTHREMNIKYTLKVFVC